MLARLNRFSVKFLLYCGLLWEIQFLKVSIRLWLFPGLFSFWGKYRQHNTILFEIVAKTQPDLQKSKKLGFVEFSPKLV